jgi:hypothetical protein
MSGLVCPAAKVPHRRVPAAGDEGDAPGAVVGWQGHDRHRLVALQDAGTPVRQRPGAARGAGRLEGRAETSHGAHRADAHGLLLRQAALPEIGKGERA